MWLWTIIYTGVVEFILSIWTSKDAIAFINQCTLWTGFGTQGYCVIIWRQSLYERVWFWTIVMTGLVEKKLFLCWTFQVTNFVFGIRKCVIWAIFKTVNGSRSLKDKWMIIRTSFNTSCIPSKTWTLTIAWHQEWIWHWTFQHTTVLKFDGVFRTLLQTIHSVAKRKVCQTGGSPTVKIMFQ